MTDQLGNPQISTLCRIRDIYRAIGEFELHFQDTYNLGLNEGMLLCSLNDQQHAANELAALLGLSHSNTSKVIKSVESKHLIRRIVGSDYKRQMYFALTEPGNQKLESIKCAELNLPEILKSVVVEKQLIRTFAGVE
jgi:DNA-binding MarR family transcriptional regulator